MDPMLCTECHPLGLLSISCSLLFLRQITPLNVDISPHIMDWLSSPFLFSQSHAARFHGQITLLNVDSSPHIVMDALSSPSMFFQSHAAHVFMDKSPHWMWTPHPTLLWTDCRFLPCSLNLMQPAFSRTNHLTKCGHLTPHCYGQIVVYFYVLSIPCSPLLNG